MSAPTDGDQPVTVRLDYANGACYRVQLPANLVGLWLDDVRELMAADDPTTMTMTTPDNGTVVFQPCLVVALVVDGLTFEQIRQPPWEAA